MQMSDRDSFSRGPLLGIRFAALVGDECQNADADHDAKRQADDRSEDVSHSVYWQDIHPGDRNTDTDK